MGLLKKVLIPTKNVLSRGVSSRRIKETVEIPKGKKLSEPWNERKGIWKSTFSYFEPKIGFFGPDLVRVLQTPIDLSRKNVKKWYDRKMDEQEDHNQKFIEERYDVLGADLAAAHFVVHRGGAVRFYNERDWVRRKEDNSYNLPRTNIPGLFVEAIDCNGMSLRHTGLENLLDLPKLRWLSFANNELVDDWTMDSVSGSYGESLQYLDITNCPKVTHRALSCFYRFQRLDTLIVGGISSSPEFKLACMMLEDIKPKLTIKGIDLSIPKNEGSKENAENE